MAAQRNRGNRRSRHNRPHCIRFNLKHFERKLRSAIGQDIVFDRQPGCPGGGVCDFTGESGRVVREYLFSEMLSKYDPGTPLPHLQEEAQRRFWEAEEMCFWTNLKFSQPHIGISESMPLLERARLEIHALLGQEFPFEEFARNFGFGPGASTRLKKKFGDSVYKYSAKAEATPNALSLVAAAVAANPIWKRMYGESSVEQSIPLVFGNRVTTVAKNYKTDRSIAIEPCLNMYVQKGLGGVLRRKLKRVGVDLDDQTLNQRAAADRRNATIDFSMASDTVASGLVAFLLPPAWVDIIGLMRSELGILPGGHIHRYSKISSMGNGFTFELESLIFWALARAVVPADSHTRIRVYGDDVIIPQEYAHQFFDLTSYCGFKPNEKKSHWTGVFRESCGSHYHDGYDITPFYIKKPVKSLPELFKLHNRLYRWMVRARPLLTRFQMSDLEDLLKSLRNLAPAKWRRPRLPDGYGDDAFIGSFAQCAPNTHKGGWECFAIEVLAATTEYVQDVPPDGSWVKTDTYFTRRRWLTPVSYTFDGTVEPARKGSRRRQILAVPWWAWG